MKQKLKFPVSLSKYWLLEVTIMFTGKYKRRLFHYKGFNFFKNVNTLRTMLASLLNKMLVRYFQNSSNLITYTDVHATLWFPTTFQLDFSWKQELSQSKDGYFHWEYNTILERNFFIDTLVTVWTRTHKDINPTRRTNSLYSMFLFIYLFLFLFFFWCFINFIMKIFAIFEIHVRYKLIIGFLTRNTVCLNIHGTHVIAKNFTNNDVVFFFVLDLKIINYNNY